MNHERAIGRQKQRRRWRVRKAIRGTADRPRLSVFRSNKHIYAQLIDDLVGKTLAAASTAEGDVQGEVGYGGNKTAATAVGKALAERAKAAGISRAALDRGHAKYHGRVAALADAARESGLEF
jgi:large subunit ribosomal protein L18